MTPGPWTQHDPDYCPLEVWGDLDGPLEDGQIHGVQVCEVLTNVDDAIAIRALPDLIKACQIVLMQHEEVGGIDNETLYAASIKECAAALRKAGAPLRCGW